MSIETDPRQGVDNPPEPTEDHLARSVMAKAAWGQRALSPWVQRQLDAGGGTQANAAPGRSPVALTLSGTRSLLGRLQRATDKGRVWRPDVGSLNPLLVDNFTESIVHRFAETPSARTRAQDTGSKVEASPAGAAHIDETELPLAGVKSEAPAEPVVQRQAPALPFTLDEVRRALENPGSSQRREPPSAGTSPARTPSTASPQAPVQREPAKPAGALPFSLAEVRAALEKPHFTQAAERPVQRTIDQPTSSPGQPGQGMPPRRRVLSRVEEVTPTAGGSAAERGISEPAADQPGALPSLDTPPAPPQVQRQIDTPKSSPKPAETPPAGTQAEPPGAPPVEPTVVEVIPFPTRPRRERPTIIPAVQRQVAPGADTPPASKAAGQAETPEPAKSSSSAARTAPAETDQTEAPTRPEAGSQTTVQRQPELELPLREPPASPAVPETPTPEETGVAASPSFPVQAQPGDHPGQSSTETRQSSEPVIQRHPEPELLMRKAVEGPTPATEPTPQEVPAIQRQPELEMPLKETPVIPTPAETPSTPSVEAGLLQRHEEAATQLSDNIPAAKPDTQGSPAVQRQPDLEMPLKERAAASIPAETPSAPSAQPTETAPLQRQEEAVAKTGASPEMPVVKPDLQETPAVQRQPDLEMPLKEPAASSTTPAEMPSAQPTETGSLQRQEEATKTGASSEMPAVKPDLQETPAVQRQPELEMPLKEPAVSSTPAAETPSAPSTEPVETAPLQRQEATAKTGDNTPAANPEPQEPRVVQRQPELEMPLRETPVVSTPVETPSAPSAQSAEAAPLQRHEAPTAKTDDTPGRPVVEPDLQETPVVQRQPDLEMPLKETPVIPTPAETPSAPSTEPVETASLQRHEEPTAKTGDSLPAVKPDLQETPVVQRHPEIEMPLKEPAVSSTPAAETSSPPSTEPVETAPLQRQEATAKTGDSLPAVKPDLQETPVVQRHPDLEMPLKEAPVASTPVETPPSPSALPAEGAPLQRHEADTPKPGDMPEMPVVKPELQETAVAQRQPDLEMPLKEPTSSPASPGKDMAEVTELAPDQEIPVPGLADSLVPPATQGVKPVVQRQVDQALDLPLRQPPLPAAESLPEGRAPETDLNQDVLARARASSDLPLLKPLSAPRSSLAQAKPDRPIAVLPQARPEGAGRVSSGPQTQTEVPAEASVPPASPPLPALPLATPRWGEVVPPAASEQPLRLPGPGLPPAAIQRQPDPATPSAEVMSAVASPDIIQRVETETTAPPSSKSEAKSSSSADLEKLARQILPEIKRMLARERDRWGR